MRSIAARLGRSPSTISRELGRNVDRAGRYRATAAHALAYERAARPKSAKLVTNRVLRERVQADLQKRYSPQQIAGRLREDFPDEAEMWVPAETIYQSLYVQSRGALRRDLHRCLRTGRALRGAQSARRPSQEPGHAGHGQRQRAAGRGCRAGRARALDGTGGCCPPRSTPRLTLRSCGCWPVPGPAVRDEPAAPGPGRLLRRPAVPGRRLRSPIGWS